MSARARHFAKGKRSLGRDLMLVLCLAECGILRIRVIRQSLDSLVSHRSKLADTPLARAAPSTQAHRQSERLKDKIPKEKPKKGLRKQLKSQHKPTTKQHQNLEGA